MNYDIESFEYLLQRIQRYRIELNFLQNLQREREAERRRSLKANLGRREMV